MFNWLLKNKNPIFLTLLIWLLPTLLSLSLKYGRKQAVFSSGESAQVQGISSTFQPTPDDYKYLNGSTVGYESNSYYIWLSDTQSLLFVLTWASTGYYSQMQLTYQLFTVGQSSTADSNIVSCYTNSVTKQLDNFYIQTSCMDFVTSIYSKKIIQYIKFHPESGINGEIHFVSIDRGIKAWNSKGEFILNPDSGQYYNLFFNVFNQVKGNLTITGYNQTVEVDGVGIFRSEKMGVLPNSFYQRYNIFYFKSNFEEDDIQFFLFQFYPAKGFKSVGPNGIGYSFLYKNNKLQFVTSDYSYTLIDGKVDPQSNYGIPTSMSLSLKSSNLSTSEISLSSENRDLDLFIGIDCLGKLPSFVKTLIQTFVTKPYLYVYLFPSSITYTDGSTKSSKVINGTVYMNTNYL